MIWIQICVRRTRLDTEESIANVSGCKCSAECMWREFSGLTESIHLEDWNSSKCKVGSSSQGVICDLHSEVYPTLSLDFYQWDVGMCAPMSSLVSSYCYWLTKALGIYLACLFVQSSFEWTHSNSAVGLKLPGSFLWRVCMCGCSGFLLQPRVNW